MHQDQIRAALGISGVQSEIYPWKTLGENESSGAQIDMLIDRADRVMNLCEMKFTRDEFIIDKDYDAKLRAKIEALMRATKNKKNIQTTIVTTYGLKSNMYSSRIQRVVPMEALFRQVDTTSNERKLKHSNTDVRFVRQIIDGPDRVRQA